MQEEQGYYIAESAADFDGWEILCVENWKPGVKRVSMRKFVNEGCVSFQMVYVKDEVFALRPISIRKLI